ncbi:hypothetical protein D3C73_1319310 [compost metagenome]
MPYRITVQRTDGLVQTHKTTTAEHGFSADMANLPVNLLVNRRFAGIAHRQVDVPALPRQGMPVLFAQAQ